MERDESGRTVSIVIGVVVVLAVIWFAARDDGSPKGTADTALVVATKAATRAARSTARQPDPTATVREHSRAAVIAGAEPECGIGCSPARFGGCSLGAVAATWDGVAFTYWPPVSKRQPRAADYCFESMADVPSWAVNATFGETACLDRTWCVGPDGGWCINRSECVPRSAADAGACYTTRSDCRAVQAWFSWEADCLPYLCDESGLAACYGVPRCEPNGLGAGDAFDVIDPLVPCGVAGCLPPNPFIDEQSLPAIREIPAPWENERDVEDDFPALHDLPAVPEAPVSREVPALPGFDDEDECDPVFGC